MSISPDSAEVQAHRNKWEYRGERRPPFAVEPKPGQESVWDYPRPPAIVPDSRLVMVALERRSNDDDDDDDELAVVAKTTKAIRICETSGPPVFYIPPEDVNFDLLCELPPSQTSLCEWKGQARYWALKKNENHQNADRRNNEQQEEELQMCGFDYPEPFPEYASIAKYIGFYPKNHGVQCTVDGEIVQPQPGPGFYAGWITKELVGPFKGEPGTEKW